ncbi:MAG: M48 family metalloprotease [Acidobacteriota bacterium]
MPHGFCLYASCLPLPVQSHLQREGCPLPLRTRDQQFAADRGGAEIVGTPTGLANALQHIEAAAKQIPPEANASTAHMFIIQPFTGGGMMKLFSSHPSTEARIKALMEFRSGV